MRANGLGYGVVLLLLAVAPVAIARGLLSDLREQHEVTRTTLAGVLAIYLLAGMFFSRSSTAWWKLSTRTPCLRRSAQATPRTGSTSASSCSPRSATAT
jgi:hypothetical protein